MEVPAEALETDEAVAWPRKVPEDQDDVWFKNEVYLVRWNAAHCKAHLGAELGDHVKVDSHAECRVCLTSLALSRDRPLGGDRRLRALLGRAEQ